MKKWMCQLDNRRRFGGGKLMMRRQTLCDVVPRPTEQLTTERARTVNCQMARTPCHAIDNPLHLCYHRASVLNNQTFPFLDAPIDQHQEWIEHMNAQCTIWMRLFSNAKIQNVTINACKFNENWSAPKITCFNAQRHRLVQFRFQYIQCTSNATIRWNCRSKQFDKYVFHLL